MKPVPTETTAGGGLESLCGHWGSTGEGSPARAATREPGRVPALGGITKRPAATAGRGVLLC